MSNDIFRVCLTGGPCSGKSNTIELLKRKERFGGYRLLLVPEVSTLFDEHGMSHEDGPAMWQGALFEAQVFLDNLYTNYAKNLNDDVLIIHDRGLQDAQVYTPDELWWEFCDKHGITRKDLLERYDCVIHLMSVAYDKPAAYNKDNLSRRETVEEARELEFATQVISNQCKNHFFISNRECDSFEDKYHKILCVITEELEKRKNGLLHK